MAQQSHKQRLGSIVATIQRRWGTRAIRRARDAPVSGLAALQPGIVPALAADALDKLRARLWYLAIQEGTYRFDNQPNLNQMLVTRVDAIRQEPELVRERVRKAVEEVVGQRPFPAMVMWPEGPGQVPNRRPLRLVVLDPSHSWGAGEMGQRKAGAFIEKIVSSAGNTFRQLKNTLVFSLPTEEGVRVMEDMAVRLLALEAIHRQYQRGGLAETQMAELQTRLDQARKGLPGAVWGAYTIIIAPSGSASGEASLWVCQEHGFAGYRPGEHTVADRAWRRLLDD